MKPKSTAHKAELSCCILLQGKERRFDDAPLCPGSFLSSCGKGPELPANAEWAFLPAAKSAPNLGGVFQHSVVGLALAILGAAAAEDLGQNEGHEQEEGAGKRSVKEGAVIGLYIGHIALHQKPRSKYQDQMP